jgi:TadE-like protein
MPARSGRADTDVCAAGPNADDGMVTAEFAVTLPTVAVVLVAAITALLAVSTQMRCTDAAATAARLLARGEPAEVAASAAHAIAGAEATVHFSTSAGLVRVDVRAPADLPLLHSLLHLPAVSADFRQPLEPGVLAS